MGELITHEQAKDALRKRVAYGAGDGSHHALLRDYIKQQEELAASASRPAWEAVAWLHDVVQSDGEQDQALSFSPDSFPLKGVGGFESIKSTPLFLAPQATHNKCDADFVALQIARRFVPYLEPQRRAQLQVAIRDAICKATPPPAVSYTDEDVMELVIAARAMYRAITDGEHAPYVELGDALAKFAHVQG